MTHNGNGYTYRSDYGDCKDTNVIPIEEIEGSIPHCPKCNRAMSNQLPDVCIYCDTSYVLEVTHEPTVHEEMFLRFVGAVQATWEDTNGKTHLRRLPAVVCMAYKPPSKEVVEKLKMHNGEYDPIIEEPIWKVGAEFPLERINIVRWQVQIPARTTDPYAYLRSARVRDMEDVGFLKDQAGTRGEIARKTFDEFMEMDMWELLRYMPIAIESSDYLKARTKRLKAEFRDILVDVKARLVSDVSADEDDDGHYYNSLMAAFQEVLEVALMRYETMEGGDAQVESKILGFLRVLEGHHEKGLDIDRLRKLSYATCKLIDELPGDVFEPPQVINHSIYQNIAYSYELDRPRSGTPSVIEVMESMAQGLIPAKSDVKYEGKGGLIDIEADLREETLILSEWDNMMATKDGQDIKEALKNSTYRRLNVNKPGRESVVFEYEPRVPLEFNRNVNLISMHLRNSNGEYVQGYFSIVITDSNDYQKTQVLDFGPLMVFGVGKQAFTTITPTKNGIGNRTYGTDCRLGKGQKLRIQIYAYEELDPTKSHIALEAVMIPREEIIAMIKKQRDEQLERERTDAGTEDEADE